MELLQDSHSAPQTALEKLRMLDVLAEDEEQLYLLDSVVRRAWPPQSHGESLSPG
ncbi:hypothetical protein ACWKT5_09995 [Streptomyces avermitilis]